jgi:hypothetical protein
MKTRHFTPAALEAITKAVQTAALLDADLMDLNAALTTGGKDTPAERLAHDVLLNALNGIRPAARALKNLADIMEDGK